MRSKGDNTQIAASREMFTINFNIASRRKLRGGETSSCFPILIAHHFFAVHLRSVLTMDLTLSFLRSVYDCPQPTNMTGAPDMYTIDNAAPTCMIDGLK